MKRHMLLHDGVRPFKCEHCEQAFHIRQVRDDFVNRSSSLVEGDEQLEWPKSKKTIELCHVVR